MTKASDNLFPKVLLDMQSSSPAAPSDRSWKLYSKADGLYARSSNSEAKLLTGAGSAFVDPMTTRGDIMVRNSSNVTARLAVGSNTYLVANGVDVSWAAGPSGSTAVGYIPYVYPLGLGPLSSSATNDDAAANGGSYLIPFFLTGPMVLHGVSVRNEDAASARSWEFRLYLDTNTSVTLNEVANANGTDSFTGAGVQIRTAACATPPTLSAGTYWLVFRNTHASNTIRTSFQSAGANNMNTVSCKTKTLGSALSSSLDLNTSWGTSENLPWIVLRGRAMGQASFWA